MMAISDDELNRAMAAVIGYSRSEQHAYWNTPYGGIASETPRYCSDRNTLPEILDAVEAAGKQWGMATRLDKDLTKGVVESAWIMWRLPMREIVVAALKALGKRPSSWDEEAA